LPGIVETASSLPLPEGIPSFVQANRVSSEQRITIEAIQQEVCAAYGVSPEALPGPARSRILVLARQVGMYFSRELVGSTYAAIGSAFGGRDHSTVIHACRRIRAEMRRSPTFADKIVKIEKNLLKTNIKKNK
jgi:chromosomal replication initiator protein